MSLWSFLRGLFAPRSVTRKIATLAPKDLDAVSETVTVGGPVKPLHRRLALRDPRLLPKRSKHTLTGKRRRVMSRDEARRLFSSSLRTRNRAIRDLLPDEEQLLRHGLPVWRNEADVAGALGIPAGTLRSLSVHREAETVSHYVTFRVPKRTGGQRLILAPKRRMKAVQRRLLELLAAKLPVSDHAHGFRKGRSVKTGAEPHVGRAVVLKLDLADFFPSVTFARVRGLLVALGYGYPVATVLATLMTEAERQPVVVEGKRFLVPIGQRHAVQGAPTSPALCNAVALRLDRRLAGLARSLGFRYTRYADDLTFSGDDTAAAARLLGGARRIVEAEGFTVNASKTRAMRKGRRQTVTGVVVNDALGLSRQDRRRLRAAIHQADGSAARREELRGHVAYVRMLSPKQAEPLAERLLRAPRG